MEPIAGKLYRLRVRVPTAYVDEVRNGRGSCGQRTLLSDVEHRIERIGWEPVLSVMQDPTDGTVFWIVAEYNRYRKADEIVSVEEARQVEEPDLSDRRPASCLDPGLAQDEVDAIRSLLARDTNPRHLYGLASTLCPYHPVAASLVRAKAELCELQAALHIRDLRDENKKSDGASLPRGPTPTLVQVLREAGCGWPDVEQAFGALRTPRFPWQWEEREQPDPGSASWRQQIDLLKKAAAEYAAEIREGGKPLPIEVLRDAVKRVACDVIEKESSEEEAPKPILELGRAIPTDLGYGIKIVRLPVLSYALPADVDAERREGFVSPSALQLVLAMQKPVFSKVVRPKRIGSRLDQLLGDSRAEHGYELLLARNQIERAERAVERRRWVEWTKRTTW